MEKSLCNIYIGNEVFFLSTSIPPASTNQDFSICVTLIEGSSLKAWKGTFDEIEENAKCIGLEEHELIDLTRKGLTRQNMGAINFEYQVLSLKNKVELSWKKVVSSVKFQIGKVLLEAVSSPPEAIKDVLLHSIRTITDLKGSIYLLESEKDRISNERKQALKFRGRKPRPAPSTITASSPTTGPSPSIAPIPATAPSPSTGPYPATAPIPTTALYPSIAPSPTTAPSPSTTPKKPFQRGHCRMLWNTTSDLHLVREVVLARPYRYKSKTKGRGKVWQEVAEAMQIRGHKVDKRAIRDRMKMLMEKYREKSRKEKADGWIEVAETEEERTIRQSVETFLQQDEETERAAKERGEEEEETVETMDGAEVWEMVSSDPYEENGLAALHEDEVTEVSTTSNQSKTNGHGTYNLIQKRLKMKQALRKEELAKRFEERRKERRYDILQEQQLKHQQQFQQQQQQMQQQFQMQQHQFQEQQQLMQQQLLQQQQIMQQQVNQNQALMMAVLQNQGKKR